MIVYATMTRANDPAEVVAMMKALYEEDPFAPEARHEQFPRTVDYLLDSPERGRIILFVEDGVLRGYALLIPFWSNEFGGNVVVVDEIFVWPDARNRGIGRGLFELLAREKPFGAVALGLETSPGNEAARRLYTSIGFAPRRNLAMTCRLPV